MANFDTIKTAIDANIKTNGTQDITGGKMNSILKQMVDATDEQLTKLESDMRLQYGGVDDIRLHKERNYSLISNTGNLSVIPNDNYESSELISVKGIRYLEYNETWDAKGAYVGVCLYDEEKSVVASFWGSGLIDLRDYPQAFYARYCGSLKANPSLVLGNTIKDGKVVGASLADRVSRVESLMTIEMRTTYDSTNLPINYQILLADGGVEVLQNDSYDTTDYINIKDAVSIKADVFPLASKYAGLCLYDSSKSLIKAFGGDVSILLSDYPDAEYVRATIVRTKAESFLSITTKSDATLEDVFEESKKYTDSKLNQRKNIITIYVGEGEEFVTIQDAVNSITDASDSKRYVVFVKSGIYDISNAGIKRIPIKPYINIVGENKATTHIIMRLSSYQSSYNIFENISGFVGEAEVKGFTLTTEKCKGALHLDDTSWNGTISFKDCIINDIEDETIHDESKDYYIYMAASYGAINLGLHLNQNIVIENITTNGYIYSHTNPRDFINMESEPSNFIVRNCVCDWLAVYANGDKVRKNCLFEGNKCNFIKIEFDDTYNLGYMAWDVLLNNNNAGFVQGLYIPYGGSVATIQNLWDNYYNGMMPCPDMMIHKYVQNLGVSRIGRGNKVVFTDATKRYIAIANSETEYDAITLCTIEPQGFGVIQDGGDLESFAKYINNHSFEKL